jgi:large subunit ribosomal protein L6
MSRIGKMPVPLSGGVSASVSNGVVEVKGPRGTLQQTLPGHVSVDVDSASVVVKRHSESKPARANHGLARSLINNMVIGVSKGFEKKLEIQGIGYRAEIKGKTLVMQLGYSHLIEYAIPDDIQVTVEKNTNLTVSGIDKQRVGQVAAVIRQFRSPDSYKGKGVRYVGEYVRLKAGKSS